MPDKFNMTVTLAFMALIAVSMAKDQNCRSVATFLARNLGLLTSDLRNRWYSGTTLAAESARTRFVVPDLPGLRRYPAMI